MYKDVVMNSITELRNYIEKILADNYDYNKEMRDNDLGYNQEQRDKMVNKTDIIFNNIGKDYAESLQRITLLGDKIVFLEEKTEKGLESHDRDMDLLEARIRSLLMIEEKQTIIIGDLRDDVNNMRHDLKILKEGL